MSEWRRGKEPTEVRFKRIVHQTPGAILFEYERKVSGKVVLEEEWIPKSLIEEVEEHEGWPEDEPGTVIIPEWKADELDWE